MQLLGRFFAIFCDVFIKSTMLIQKIEKKIQLFPFNHGDMANVKKVPFFDFLTFFYEIVENVNFFADSDRAHRV